MLRMASKSVSGELESKSFPGLRPWTPLGEGGRGAQSAPQNLPAFKDSLRSSCASRLNFGLYAAALVPQYLYFGTPINKWRRGAWNGSISKNLS